MSGLTVADLEILSKTFINMCSVGVSPWNAIILTAEQHRLDRQQRDTLLQKFLAATIEENMMHKSMGVEKAVRDAFRQFDISNERALQDTIRYLEIEHARIHDTKKGELVGVGFVGGKKGLDGKVLGAIQIVDKDGEPVVLTREQLQKKD